MSATFFICLLALTLLAAWLLGVFEQKPSGETPYGVVTLYHYIPGGRPMFENQTQDQTAALWDKVKDHHAVKFVVEEEEYCSVIAYLHLWSGWARLLKRMLF